MEFLLLAGLGCAMYGLFDFILGDDSSESSSQNDDAVRENDNQNSTDTVERYLGNNSADIINLGDGNDLAFTFGGDDEVIDGFGDDRVFLGSGNDTLAPESFIEGTTDSRVAQLQTAGDDFIRGQAGDDLLVQISGQDTLYGDVGDDILFAVDGIGDESDFVYGGIGDDILYGDEGDLLSGGAGADTFTVLTGTQDTPPEITDFNENSGDRLVIIAPDGLDPTTLVKFRTGSDLQILSPTQVIVKLQNVTDIDLGKVTLVDGNGNETPAVNNPF